MHLFPELLPSPILEPRNYMKAEPGSLEISQLEGPYHSTFPDYRKLPQEARRKQEGTLS